MTIVVRNFTPMTDAAIPFYEAPWFASVVRSGVALLAVLLVLLLGVRPLIKALRRSQEPRDPDEAGNAPSLAPPGEEGSTDTARGGASARPGMIDANLLSQHVGLAQRLVAEKPENAVVALRQMLKNEPNPEAAQ